MEPRQILIRDSRVIIVLLSLLSVMGTGLIIREARGIVLPFALAVFFSYILNPLIAFFEKRRVPRVISILIAVVVTFLVLGLIVFLINTSIFSFAAEFPRYEERFGLIVNNLIDLYKIPPELFSTQTGRSEWFKLLANLENFSVTGVITATLSQLTNFLSNTVLVLLFLLFILMGRNQLNHKLEIAFKPQMSQRLAVISTNINKEVQKYIVMKTLLSLITAVVVTVVLFFFKVEFAMIWGILTFLLTFIPNIGAFIAAVLPITISIIQFDSYFTIFAVAISLFVIHFIMGNVVDPNVIGGSVNLSPLVVLFALIFWGWLLGIVGMFLAIPLTVIFKIIFDNIDSLRFISILMSARR